MPDEVKRAIRALGTMAWISRPDVIPSGRDLPGDGVDVAARLQQPALPGPARLPAIGCASGRRHRRRSTARPLPRAPEPPSIAVLPFLDRGAERDLELAEAPAHRLHELDPPDHAARAVLGHIAVRRLRHGGSLASLREARRLSPGDV